MIRFTKNATKILLALLFLAALHLQASPLESQKEESCRIEFEKLWKAFISDGKKFVTWRSNWTEEELKAQYDQTVIDRWTLYFENAEDYRIPNAIGRYKAPFQIPENWQSWHSRYPYPLAFSYNLAIANYNASFLWIDGHRILAIESPSDQNQSSFYQLFNVYKISQFVHLLSQVEEGENYYPYWKEHLRKQEDGLFLQLGGQNIRFFPYRLWIQRNVIEAQQLLALVKQIKCNQPPEGILGVCCRAGTGRTGTLIAAYLLICDIDQQLKQKVSVNELKISIDELLWKLCLQRPFIVPHFCQYKLLYELVNCYINEIKNALPEG